MIVQYFKNAHRELVDNFLKYRSIYFVFFIISILSVWVDFFIPRDMETFRYGMNILLFVFTVFASVLFLKLVKRDSVKGDFWYLFVPFLLYSVYYSIVSLLGFIILFIPAVLFYYAPIIATYADVKSPFKSALKLAKKNFKLTAVLAYSSIALELIPEAFKAIPQREIAAGASLIYAFFDAYIVIILMIISVNYFYESEELIRSTVVES